MSKYYFLLTAVITMMACNNEPAPKEIPAADTIVVKAKDTVPKKDTAVTDISFALSEAEIGDDSIFTDGSQPTSWANAGIEHPLQFKYFLKRLQYWVTNNMKDSVAGVIAFPLKKPRLANKAAFIAKYDSIFTPAVKNALLTQNMRQLFRSDQGAMVGAGEIWFTETRKGFFITTINH